MTEVFNMMEQYPKEKEKAFDKHLAIIAGKNKKKIIRYRNGVKRIKWSWTSV